MAPTMRYTEGDVVKLTAGSLNTVAGTKIRARLPFVNAQGTETSMPALTLTVTTDNAFDRLLQAITRRAIVHFFERYKDLEDGKWVKPPTYSPASIEPIIDAQVEGGSPDVMPACRGVGETRAHS